MAFYREYELRNDTLIKYFYLNEKDSEPALVIRLDTDTQSFFVRNFRVSHAIVLDEIRRLLDLLDSPHWRSFVNCCTTRSSRERIYELFSSYNY